MPMSRASGTIALPLAAAGAATTHPTYPLGSAASCKANYVERILSHKVNGKTEQYIACVYVAPKAKPKPAPKPTTSSTGIGHVVKDGDFAFVVKSIECGAKADAAVAGSDGFGETVPAGAQECLVTMTVTDDKGTAQTYFASNQYAYDGKTQFSADSDATIYLSDSNDDTQVNPGITITVVVPFQIPSKDTITSLDLHDSAFSGGVTVNV
jgi:Domain of unknown function (DUF4352)